MQPVRAILATTELGERLLVLRSGGPMPVVEFESPVLSWGGTPAAGYQVTTELGEVRVGPSGHCRCGAGVLLSYDPFPGQRRVRASNAVRVQ
jgi:hypothetical protein